MTRVLFREHMFPRPRTEEWESTRVQSPLEQFVQANDIRFRVAQVPDHQFTEKHCHSSAPDVFFAAGATRTMRLGHEMHHAPPPINHRARIAKRVSVLDLIPDGRVELSTSGSPSAIEIGSFHFGPPDKGSMWSEAAEPLAEIPAEMAARARTAQAGL